MLKTLQNTLLASSVALLPLAGCTHLTQVEKTQLLQAAESLTEAAFTAGAPVLSEAVVALPAEVQVLVQAGYGALRKAVEVAESSAVSSADAQAAVQAVAATADNLSQVVHASTPAATTQP